MLKYVRQSKNKATVCEIEESLQSADHPDLAAFATSSTMATRRSVLN